MKVYDNISNRLLDSSTVLIVDKLLKLRSEKTMWDVTDEIIKWWIETKPKEWKSHLMELSDLKETRINSFASNKDKSLRYVLDIPEKIIMILRKLYNVQECPMDKKWMLKFARRYPKFVVAERI